MRPQQQLTVHKQRLSDVGSLLGKEQFSWKSPSVTRSVFPTTSPQWWVVELDTQQVPHANLGRVVNHKLIVQEGVAVAFTHSCLHSWTHWHIYTIISEIKIEKYKWKFMFGLYELHHVMWQTNRVTDFLGSGPVCPKPFVLCFPSGRLLAS